MFNLAAFRHPEKSLADYLPWACLVEGGDAESGRPAILLNKDGSFLCAARFRGPDMGDATPSEQIAFSARINQVLKRLGCGWVLFVEARRQPVDDYPVSHFPDDLSQLIDAERRVAFETLQARFETVHYLCLQWLPPADATRTAQDFLFTSRTTQNAAANLNNDIHDNNECAGPAREQVQQFVSEALRLFDQLTLLVPEFSSLDGTALLTYLHSCVSTRPHPVAVPEVPAYLDAWLADTTLTGGLTPCLGDQHLRSLTIRGFPPETANGMMAALEALNFPYRWMTRWIALDRIDVERVLMRARRHWFAKRKSLGAILKETLFNEAVSLTDPNATAFVDDADTALESLGQSHVAFGYMTATLTIMHKDAGTADAWLRALERDVTAAGLIVIPETLNAVEAWLSSIPGQTHANVRRPPVHTLNLTHLLPVSALWAGQGKNMHWKENDQPTPPLLIAKAGGSTPFRLVTHIGDVGHSLIIGPTGAGKSVLLSLMIAQMRRYKHAQVFVFDKGQSSRAMILGVGGSFVGLATGEAPELQPLATIDQPASRSWAADWLEGLLIAEGIPSTPSLKSALWAALDSLAAAPIVQRTMSGLSAVLGASHLRQGLAPYCLGGAFGALIDGSRTRLEDHDVQGFETEELLTLPKAAAPVLAFLLHHLEQRFCGRPTLLVLDEAWAYLDHPVFAHKLRDWLKTLRKKNVAVIFATQSLADLEGHALTAALIESCPTRILLPNARALEPNIASIYRRFGLNETQIELLSSATPKRDYYLQSPLGTRLFELDLGEVAQAFCAANGVDDQQAIDAIVDDMAANDTRDLFGPEIARLDSFAVRWLTHCGQHEAADFLRDFDPSIKPATEEKHYVSAQNS
jgi:type IV secretion system protein TrbE